MNEITRIGIDTSKHVFQFHGVDADEQPVLRRKLRRREKIASFEKLTPTHVAIEACDASHHWARLLSGFGQKVQLIAPQLVKPYVKRGKNDAADAEALCVAIASVHVRAREQAGHMNASNRMARTAFIHLARRGPSTYGTCSSTCPRRCAVSWSAASPRSGR